MKARLLFDKMLGKKSEDDPNLADFKLKLTEAGDLLRQEEQARNAVISAENGVGEHAGVSKLSKLIKYFKTVDSNLVPSVSEHDLGVNDCYQVDKFNEKELVDAYRSASPANSVDVEKLRDYKKVHVVSDKCDQWLDTKAKAVKVTYGEYRKLKNDYAYQLLHLIEKPFWLVYMVSLLITLCVSDVFPRIIISMALKKYVYSSLWATSLLFIFLMIALVVLVIVALDKLFGIFDDDDAFVKQKPDVFDDFELTNSNIAEMERKHVYLLEHDVQASLKADRYRYGWAYGIMIVALVALGVFTLRILLPLFNILPSVDINWFGKVAVIDYSSTIFYMLGIGVVVLVIDFFYYKVDAFDLHTFNTAGYLQMPNKLYVDVIMHTHDEGLSNYKVVYELSEQLAEVKATKYQDTDSYALWADIIKKPTPSCQRALDLINYQPSQEEVITQDDLKLALGITDKEDALKTIGLSLYYIDFPNVKVLKEVIAKANSMLAEYHKSKQAVQEDELIKSLPAMLRNKHFIDFAIKSINNDLVNSWDGLIDLYADLTHRKLGLIDVLGD